MAEGLNKVMLFGNLGADPEFRTTQGGTGVLKLRLATTERYKDNAGAWQDRTEWHRVVVWGKRAEALHRTTSLARPSVVLSCASRSFARSSNRLLFCSRCSLRILRALSMLSLCCAIQMRVEDFGRGMRDSEGEWREHPETCECGECGWLWWETEPTACACGEVSRVEVDDDRASAEACP